MLLVYDYHSFLDLHLLSFSLEFCNELLGFRDAFNSYALGCLQDVSASFFLFKGEFKVGEVDPRSWVFCEFLAVELVYFSDSVKLPKVLFHLNVSLKHLFFGKNANSPSIGFPGFGKIIAPETKVGVKDPQFSKGKLLVRHQLDGSVPYLISSLHILAHLLLKNSIIVPKIHIPPPESFLLCQWLMLQGFFIDLPDSGHILGCFFKKNQIQPSIIVVDVFSQLIFVDVSPLTQHNLINFFMRPMLFFKVDVHLIQFSGFIFGDMPQPKFEDLSGPFIFPLFDLEFRKLYEVFLIQSINPQLGHNPFKNRPSCISVSVPHFELSHFQVGFQLRKGLQIAIEHCLSIFRLPHPLLKFDEGHPSLLPRAPLHPPAKDIPSFLLLPYKLLHVGIFEPELILPRQVVNSPLPHISGVIDEFVLHFHFGVLEPQTFVGVVDLKSPLEDRSGPGIFFEILLPLTVPDPDRQIVSLPSEFILEFPSLLLLVDMELFLIHDSLDGRAEGNGPMDLSILENLIGSDLNNSSLLVFDRRGFHLNLWHCFSYKQQLYHIIQNRSTLLIQTK